NRQGLWRDATPGHEGILSVETAVSAAARGYRLEVPRHDPPSRPDRRALRHDASGPHQCRGNRARYQPDILRFAAAYAGHEDRGPETGARQMEFRRGLWRRAPRRGKEQGEGARV